MLRYVLKRVALGLVSLLLLTVMIFLAAQVLPGNPGRIVLGREATPGAVEQFNHALGIDRPLPVRYADWLSDAVRGDFGANYTDGRAVTDDLVPALKRSLFLAIYAFILCVPISILAGVIAALRRGKPTDRAITVSGLSLAVIPEFVLGAILVTLLGPAWLNWFPGVAGALIGASFATKLESLFLPALALALVLFGYIARMARAGTMEALDADFTRTATLKGLKQRQVLGRHVLRNGLLPTIAVISTQVGYLFGGIVAIEKLFGYPGIGFLTVTAAQIKNFPMLLACVLVIGVIYFVATLAGDLLTAALNPACGSRGKRERSAASCCGGGRSASRGTATRYTATRPARDPATDPPLDDVHPRRPRHPVLGRLRVVRTADRALRPLRVVRIQLRASLWSHPFGLDRLGRDVLSRVIVGARSVSSRSLRPRVCSGSRSARSSG